MNTMNTVDAQEIENFSKDSSKWWDVNGPFKPLHRLNPVRLSYFKQQICDHFDRDVEGFKSYEGLSILDIGCGGGLVCEPMTRLGGAVTGIDADANAIDCAAAHAAQGELEIEYLNKSTSDLLSLSSSPSPCGDLQKKNQMPAQGGHDGRLNNEAAQYDVVLALEIIEHVADLDLFVKEVTALCKPGGLIIFSTLNRTPQSYALGIIAAEHILRWVPRGTHNWKKFVKPSELARMVRNNGATPKNVTGMVFNPFKKNFALSKNDTAVNYFMSVVKPQD